MPKSKGKQMLGHGDHWAALGLAGGDLSVFVRSATAHGRSIGNFYPPWPKSGFAQLNQIEWMQASLVFAMIVGQRNPDPNWLFLSAFPILAKTEEWIVRIDGVQGSYGAVEGLIEGRAASGHGLQWFAPRFGFEADRWRQIGFARVGFSALALSLEPFDAKPIVVDQGPRVEEERERLRAEGLIEEAERPNLTVTFATDRMRTFYSTSHDHHAFVGKVMEIHAIRPRPEFHGWRLELECLPEKLETGWRLPLYVFPSALKSGYQPARGDLVRGIAWLQGTWKAPASAEDTALWKKTGGEWFT